MNNTFNADKFFDSLDNDNKQAHKEIKRNACLNITYSITPQGLTTNVWRCKDFRNCENCRNWRAKLEFDKFKVALNEGDLTRVTLSEKNAKKLALKMDKRTYRRYPHDDGTVTFIISEIPLLTKRSQYLLEDSELLNQYNIENDDLKKLCDELTNTPHRKKMSGNLFISDEDEPDIKVTENAIQVPVYIAMTNDIGLIKALYDQALSLTDAVSDMQTYVNELTQSLKTLLKLNNIDSEFAYYRTYYI